MAIRARLDGDEYDLKTLALIFGGGELKVGKDEDSLPYYLSTHLLDDLGEADIADRLPKRSQQLLTYVNGVARAFVPGFRPVRLVGRFHDDRSDIHWLIAEEQVTIRDETVPILVDEDGEIQQSPPDVSHYATAAVANPVVAEALTVLGSDEPELGWVDLYKVFEIVKDDLHKRDNLHGADAARACAVQLKDLDAFAASANRPDVSGRAARHARTPGDPPKHTMGLTQAQAFIGDLVAGWLFHAAHRDGDSASP